MDGYLAALLNGGDFGQFFTDDVAWTTMETGDHVRGREAVRDYILALHTQLFDAHPEVRSVAVADGIAALEADFVGTHIAEFAGIPATGSDIRVPYCVAYDLGDAGITALRGYFPVSQIVAQLQAAQSSA
jgi:steroid delta-isomerase-like uncharacterized protein